MSKFKSMIANLPKWRSAPQGKHLNLKDWLVYCFGGCGAYGACMLIQFFTLAQGLFIAAALNINVDHVAIIGVITSIVTVLTSPLASYIIDNTNSKLGKFRPYLLWLPVPIIISFVVMGQVLVHIPDYTAMLITYTVIFNIGYFLNRLYSTAFNSIVQVISPSMEERTQLMSIGTFFTSLGPTIVGMLFPTIANFLYTEGAVSGVNNIKSFLVIVPIFAGVLFGIGIFFALGVKERMVLPKTFRQKQSFVSGIKKTFKNKYFWLTNVSGILGTFRMIATTFTMWIILYSIFPQLVANGKQNVATYIQAIVTTLIGDACVPGMLFAPFLIRKFGKKKLILFTNAMTTVCTIPMLFIRNPYALLAMIYLVTFFNGLQIVTGPAIQAEIYDYQQYKTGDRLEGFISQFGTMITTAIGIGFAFVTPAVYKSFGYIDDESVLYATDILLGIIRTLCGIGVASGFLAIIPYLFYDLNEKRHKKIMNILTVRAKLDDGVISKEDATDLERRIEDGEENVLDIFSETDKTNEISAETFNTNKEVADLINAEETLLEKHKSTQSAILENLDKEEKNDTLTNVEDDNSSEKN